MNGARYSPLETAERLCETLERVADALMDVDNDTLLATEATLVELVASIDTGAQAAAMDRLAVEAVVRRGRTALMRCRRLAASFMAVARARVSLCTPRDTYNRAGALADASSPSPTVRAAI
jgi:hypothetical protein